MTKLNRWPGEYHRPPRPEVELFPAFDQTLAGDMDETVRNLRVLTERSGSSHEEKQWQLKAFDTIEKQTAELRKVIKAMQLVIGRKASLTAQAEFEKALTERIDKRIDTIRSVAMWAIGILVVIMGLIKLIK